MLSIEEEQRMGISMPDYRARRFEAITPGLADRVTLRTPGRIIFDFSSLQCYFYWYFQIFLLKLAEGNEFPHHAAHPGGHELLRAGISSHFA